MQVGLLPGTQPLVEPEEPRSAVQQHVGKEQWLPPSTPGCLEESQIRCYLRGVAVVGPGCGQILSPVG